MDRTLTQSGYALANLGENRGTTFGASLAASIASNTEGWAHRAAELEVAKCHYNAGHIDEAIRICDELLASETDPTTFRGRALRLRAAATMARPEPSDIQLDEAQEWLEEAARIFDKNTDPYQLSQCWQLQAQVALWRGEQEHANDLMALGRRAERAWLPRGHQETRREPAGQIAG